MRNNFEMCVVEIVIINMKSLIGLSAPGYIVLIGKNYQLDEVAHMRDVILKRK